MNMLLNLLAVLVGISPISQTATTSPATQAASRPSEIKTVRDAQAFLQRRAEEVIPRCRIFADDGTAVYVPDEQKNYRAFWVRDFCYMVEGCPEAFPAEELQRGYRWLLARQRSDGAMPDRVQLDGKAIYLPGPTDHPLCAEPVTDGPQFMVKLAYAVLHETRNPDLFTETWEQLARGLRSLPIDPEQYLVFISPDTSRCPYGFTDTVVKKGDLLFSSLLYIDACQKLSEMLRDIGYGGQSKYWEGQADHARAGIESLWDPASGYYMAASMKCRQPDVWGTAYAVYLGVTPPEHTHRIARQLLKDYDRIVQAGQVRHLPAPLSWESCVTPPGTYQNGGYWGVPSGWVYAAIRQVDPRRADQLIIDMARDYEARGAAPEWTNGPKFALTGYAASLTTPLEALRKVANPQPTR